MRSDGKVFRPGFRFSLLDAAVLILGGFLGMYVAAVMFWLGVAICFVVAHFFLFCNVLRMTRVSELAWAAIFTLSMAATILTGVPSWPITFGISLTVTLMLVVLEMRKASYHGVLWRMINPRLPQWWAEQT
jgi:hypothetical protein